MFTHLEKWFMSYKDCTHLIYVKMLQNFPFERVAFSPFLSWLASAAWAGSEELNSLLVFNLWCLPSHFCAMWIKCNLYSFSVKGREKQHEKNLLSKLFEVVIFPQIVRNKSGLINFQVFCFRWRIKEAAVKKWLNFVVCVW